VTVTVPFPEPDDGLALAQLMLSVTDQSVVDVIVIE